MRNPLTFAREQRNIPGARIEIVEKEVIERGTVSTIAARALKLDCAVLVKKVYEAAVFRIGGAIKHDPLRSE